MSSQGANIFILYPRKDGSTFNKEYYQNKHMPLVSEIWQKYGLKSWSVTEAVEGGPYDVVTLVEFESLEGFAKAQQDPRTPEITGDVGNFSSVEPAFSVGNIIARL
ncbi:hypothetical protein ACHAQA_003079 [Verticillium albo-atrum]